ncbi:IclR family transcriptional regulator [Alcaligenaceae bacterium]|nr:IclR family transcriptional regulator [Alcaligenaceae bacterium]
MIRAVARALAVFDAYDNDHLSLSLQDIAKRIGMPKTTTFRLVNTLERAGFLMRMDSQQYCLSLKLARLGGLVRSTLSISEIARPVMQQVNEQTSETISLNVIVGNDRMVLEVVDTPSPLMSMVRPGQNMPLNLSASSGVLLAHMEPEELERVLKVIITEPTFDRAALDRELAHVRQQGYAISHGQRVPGLTAIAVPIFDIHDNVRHCLALTGPSIRVDVRGDALADIMIAAGRNISSRLGASPEHSVDMKLLMGDAAKNTSIPARKKPVAKKVAAKKRTEASATE